MIHRPIPNPGLTALLALAVSTAPVRNATTRIANALHGPTAYLAAVKALQ